MRHRVDMTLSQPSVSSAEEELAGWWRAHSEVEIEMLVPKSIEYGANSLTRLGTTMAAAAGREVDEEEAIELGIYFYILGKLERWTDAVLRGDRPKDDALLDIGVYARMAQRNREVGSWPGAVGSNETDNGRERGSA